MKQTIDDDTTIFTAEAFAIMKSLEYVKHKNFNRVVILSDSLSVLLALKKLYDPNNLKRIHPHILIIKQLIYSLKTNGIEIQIVWVKAHVGILYNEQVDILAKESYPHRTNCGRFMPLRLYKDETINDKEKMVIPLE